MRASCSGRVPNGGLAFCSRADDACGGCGRAGHDRCHGVAMPSPAVSEPFQRRSAALWQARRLSRGSGGRCRQGATAAPYGGVGGDAPPASPYGNLWQVARDDGTGPGSTSLAHRSCTAAAHTRGRGAMTVRRSHDATSHGRCGARERDAATAGRRRQRAPQTMPTGAGARLAAKRRMGVAERGRGARGGLERLSSRAGARLLCHAARVVAAAADGEDRTRARGRSVAARACASPRKSACQNSWTGRARQWCEVRAFETRAAKPASNGAV